MTSDLKIPYLIQRISEVAKDPRIGKSGVDAYFYFDYMGSAEFEFGALPEAMQSLRKNKNAVVKKIECDGYKSYFVGNATELPVATEVFKDGLTGEKIRYKEWTGIYESFRENPRVPVGWWSVDDDKPSWALFKLEHHAHLWKKLVYGEGQIAQNKKTGEQSLRKMG